MTRALKDLLNYVADKQGKHKQGSLITAAICRSAVERLTELDLELEEARLALDAAVDPDRLHLADHRSTIGKAIVFADRYRLGERRRNS